MIGWKANWISPGLAYTQSYLSRFLVSPVAAHLQAPKDILRFFKMTRDKGPIYRRANLPFGMQPDELRAWGDFTMDIDRFRSTPEHLILLNRAAIFWKSQMQPIADVHHGSWSESCSFGPNKADHWSAVLISRYWC